MAIKKYLLLKYNLPTRLIWAVGMHMAHTVAKYILPKQVNNMNLGYCSIASYRSLS